MRQPENIQSFLQREVLRRAVTGFLVLIAASLIVSFMMAREQASSELLESARATAEAFHNSILDGDIRFSEPKIKSVLKIEEGEIAKVLRADGTPVYDPVGMPPLQMTFCPKLDRPCFVGFFGPVNILVPISLNPQSENPERSLFISKKVHLNWNFIITIFSVFTLGYFVLVMIFIRLSKRASSELSNELLLWSERLKANPKDAAPLEAPPFAELMPLKSAIEGLNLQIKQFEQTASDRTSFLILRGIGHDLLNPVSRLQTLLAILVRRIDQEKNKEIIGDLNKSLRKVITFASQVKTLKEKSTPGESSELVSTIREEILSLQESEIVKNKSIKLEFDPKVATMYSPFSSIEISRILLNLVENSANASAPGSVIRVEAGRSGAENYFSVEDRGCGIESENLNRIFDADFTLKPVTGTGLGLTIVKILCEKYSAKIDLQSTPGSGTKIVITTKVIERGQDVQDSIA